MSRVKVTNITHQVGTVGPSSGVCIKFMDADLMPGQSILISMEQLPSEWKNMRNAFEFQFLGDESSITNQNTVVNQNVDFSALQQMIAQGIKDMAVQQQAAVVVPEAAPVPAMDMTALQQLISQGIKDGIAEGMKNVKPATTIIHQNGGFVGDFGSAGIGQASFIPEIKDVKDISNLSKESEIIEGPKKESLKEKLKKLNKGV